MLEYGSISRFKGVFSEVWGFRVGLCCLGGLRGLCGFCTRVELGGLKACCVFAFVFPILCPFISVFALLLSPCLFSGLCLCYSLLVLFACFVCPCGLVDFVVVSFSLSDICAKRKGAKCLPCVLSCPVVGCIILLLLYIPRIRQVSARLYRNKVLEKGNLTECSKLFCARPCSCLCSSRFVFLLFSYLLLLVGSYFLFPFRLCKIRFPILVKFVIVSLNLFGDTFV